MPTIQDLSKLTDGQFLRWLAENLNRAGSYSFHHKNYIANRLLLLPTGTGQPVVGRF